MPTDADILRTIASKAGVDYYGVAVDPADLGFNDDTAALSAVVDATNRAADAIEENARLRALLATLRTDMLDEANRRLGTAWGDSCGRRVAMIDGTIWDADAFASGGADALRTPGAGGSHE